MANDLDVLVPATVMLVFPDHSPGAPAGAVFTSSVSLHSLKLSQYGDTIGFAGAKVWHSTADYDGTNATELNALATQAATDWYLWQLARVDGTYNGVVDWTPGGVEDVEWVCGEGRIETRVRRTPYLDHAEELLQSGAAGSVTLDTGLIIALPIKVCLGAAGSGSGSGSTGACGVCQDCTPSSLTFTISGVTTDGAGNDISSLNGDYSLTAGTGDSACSWSGTGPNGLTAAISIGPHLRDATLLIEGLATGEVTGAISSSLGATLNDICAGGFSFDEVLSAGASITIMGGPLLTIVVNNPNQDPTTGGCGDGASSTPTGGAVAGVDVIVEYQDFRFPPGYGPIPGTKFCITNPIGCCLTDGDGSGSGSGGGGGANVTCCPDRILPTELAFVATFNCPAGGAQVFSGVLTWIGGVGYIGTVNHGGPETDVTVDLICDGTTWEAGIATANVPNFCGGTFVDSRSGLSIRCDLIYLLLHFTGVVGATSYDITLEIME